MNDALNGNPGDVLLQHTGILTAADAKRAIDVGVQVPPGLEGLRIAFTFQPVEVRSVRNLVTLTLLGPDGFRGSGHRHGGEHLVHLSEGAASPGYLPGPITPGTWRVGLDPHVVVEGAPCTYRLEVSSEAAPEHGGDASDARMRPNDASRTARAPMRSPAGDPRRPARDRGPGWYAGDLHCHTIHSDGKWTPSELLAAARVRGLDFLAITDHNTTSAHADPAVTDEGEMLVIEAMELTTFHGHALSLGAGEWIDWRRPGRDPAATPYVQAVRDAGGLFVMAHPYSLGDPICSGCDWNYPDVWPGPARFVEVWNGPWDSDRNNPAALALWYRWLREGHRLVATAGTDEHGPAYRDRMGFARVYADALSRTALLSALRQGRLYVTNGPTLNVEARSENGATAMIGGTLAASEATFTVDWSGADEGAYLQLVTRRGELSVGAIEHAGRHATRVTTDEAWVVAELRNASHRLLALSNPVFLGGPGAQ